MHVNIFLKQVLVDHHDCQVACIDHSRYCVRVCHICNIGTKFSNVCTLLS